MESKMSLKEDIQQLREQTLAKAPQEVIDVLLATTAELKQQGIENKALGAGDLAIDFNLPNIDGENINLTQALRKGPVVLNIYRGGWCPYCNLELNALQKALAEIESAGGQLIAVAPQLPDKSIESVNRHQLTFEVLSDVGNKVSRQYGLVFTLPEALRPIYEQFALDVPGYNGDDSFELPIPATYVIKQSGEIVHAFVDADYTQRMEPADIVNILKSLSFNSYC